LASALVGAGLLVLAGACGKGPSATTTTTPTADGQQEVAEAAGRGRASPTGAPANAPADEDVEELYIDGVRLRLQPNGCELTVSFLDQRHRHRFESFPGACHFAPDRHGQPWVVLTDHGNAVLVESSAPAEGGCNTALQVVVVTERGPQLSREIQRVSGCGPGPWDEMMYHVLASDRVNLGASRDSSPAAI
jgi:hypothetical protein